MKRGKHDIIIITGPTASGKTGFAARLAYHLRSEVISADSRQVYRKMNLGTGKDYDDYIVDGYRVPSSLIDIVDAGYKYNVYEFQCDFLREYRRISSAGATPVVCGGSGMYIDSIVSGYRLIQVPPNPLLRKELETLELDDLVQRLSTYKSLHNRSDNDSVKRAVRAIEIEEYYLNNPDIDHSFPDLKSLIFGIRYDRESRRKRISTRLKARLEEGMIDEVRELIEIGVPIETLVYYGLEYKYIALHLTGKLSYESMFTGLETAIHQFAKRQMTWFRGMERRGVKIHWLDGYMPEKEKLNRVVELL